MKLATFNFSKATLLAAFLATAFGVLTANAQIYSIDWHKVAGGGGVSTGGTYSVMGTIGQHDVGGPMTQGPYAVTGGFWVLPTAVQVPGAPTLTIVPGKPGQAIISWAPATPGFILQESPSLSPVTWTDSLTGATNPVTVPAAAPAKFYRLFKP